MAFKNILILLSATCLVSCGYITQPETSKVDIIIYTDSLGRIYDKWDENNCHLGNIEPFVVDTVIDQDNNVVLLYDYLGSGFYWDSIVYIDSVDYETKKRMLEPYFENVPSSLIEFLKTMPTKFVVQPVYPNPATNYVNIRFQIPEEGQRKIKITIVNQLTQNVITVLDVISRPGYYSATSDLIDNSGTKLEKGLYRIIYEYGDETYGCNLLIE
jgi:hypothetical protein